MLGTKNMSNENETADEVCASCGRPAVDDVKLKKCACDLVKYCSVDCQKNHRPQHKKMCKKRLAELRERDLFEQPDGTHEGDCPICCLPLPIVLEESHITFMSCCSKLICNGCDLANKKREMKEGLEPRCAFCREPVVKSQEEHTKRVMERAKKNNPAAMCHMGKKHYFEGDHEQALEYLTKAAALGDADAHFSLSCMYRLGESVEKDMKKEIYHLEEAAIGGHPLARCSLGCNEVKKCRFERAKKHFIIAANLQHEGALEMLKNLNAAGFASEEEYTAAQRAYQVAVDATKSSEREEAKAYKAATY
jgi:tetratricopeptide (TPR) repeat protein